MADEKKPTDGGDADTATANDDAGKTGDDSADLATLIAAQNEKLAQQGEQIEKLTKSLSALHAQRRVTDKGSDTTTTANTDNGNGNGDGKGKPDPVAALRAELLAERTKSTTKLIRSEVRSAISGQKIESEAQELLFDHIMARHGSALKVDTETDEVFSENDLGERVAVSQLVGDVLKSPLGKRLVPPTQVGNSRGLKGSAATGPTGKKYSEMSPAELAKLSPEQERSLRLAELNTE